VDILRDILETILTLGVIGLLVVAIPTLFLLVIQVATSLDDRLSK
jgi:hypothetical protein